MKMTLYEEGIIERDYKLNSLQIRLNIHENIDM